MSASCGPIRFDTVNCTLAKTTPQVTTAGHTSAIAAAPLVTRMMYAGRQSENGNVSLPTTALNCLSGRPVIAASVMIGMPIDPNATGAVSASMQMVDAYSDVNPSPTIIAAATATGVPNPAHPSMNAPNANAISSA